jgi:CDGSH-type Zn-finger protein
MTSKKEPAKKTSKENTSSKLPAHDNFQIKIRKDGPYEVSGGVPLEQNIPISDSEGIPYDWRTGGIYPTQEKYLLCRCGESKTTPFCDGTHTHIKFNGTETADNVPFLKKAETIHGESIDLKDAEDLCIHAGFCDRASGIWNLVDNSGNPEARDVAVEEASDCPSGRLVILDKDGKEIEPKFKPAIGLVVEDADQGILGALWVRGGIPIEGAAGTKYEVRNRVTLCRCGRSSNKPFCDGSHYDE